jgi:hypothetical protein
MKELTSEESKRLYQYLLLPESELLDIAIMNERDKCRDKLETLTGDEFLKMQGECRKLKWLLRLKEIIKGQFGKPDGDAVQP